MARGAVTGRQVVVPHSPVVSGGDCSLAESSRLLKLCVDRRDDGRVWDSLEVRTAIDLGALDGTAIGFVDVQNHAPQLAVVDNQEGDVSPSLQEREAKEGFDLLQGAGGPWPCKQLTLWLVNRMVWALHK